MTTFEQGHGLIIGVGADLPNTVQDAAGLAEMLQDPARCAYAPDQVHLLAGEEATREHILNALDTLARTTDEEATIIVYYSGHGYQVRSPMGEFYYLLPYGYQMAQLYQTAINGAEFTQKLRALPAQKLLLLLDCCHAGGVGEAKAPQPAGMQMSKSPLPPEAQSLLTEGHGRVIIASSRQDERSFAGKPYSAFTLALIEAFSGEGVTKKDGFVRVADLALHAREVVPGRTQNRQHPILHFERADNFVLGYYAAGETQPKGLPFTERPAIEPQPGAWRGIDQSGQVVHGTQVTIGGSVDGQVAVGADAPVIQFGNVSGGRVNVDASAAAAPDESDEEKAAERVVCPSCGREARPGARFCNACGHEIAPKS